MAETPTVPTPPVPAPAPKVRSVQDKAVGAYSTLAGTILTTALTNTDIATKLATRSYTPAKIGAGVALQNAAQLAYNNRQNALGDRFGAVDDLTRAFEEETNHYEAFRDLARSFFPDQGDRTTLNLSGPIPQNRASFIAFARAGYTNAMGATYQAELAALGYDTAKLGDELDELANLEKEISQRQVAGGEAAVSVQTRNTAFRALKEWMDKLEGVAKVALSPDLALLPFKDLPNVSLPKK